MSIGSISDSLSQVSQIEDQLDQLTNGSLLSSLVGASGGAVASTASAPSGTGAGDFSAALAQAVGTGGGSTATEGATASAAAAGSPESSVGSTVATAIGSSAGTSSDLPATLTSASTDAVPTGTGSALLTSGQQQFASTLSADTGLNPGVISSWLLAEESGSAAQSRQLANNNDWLNIGYTDSSTYGAGDAVWSDPTTAANATAQWLQGQASVAGYGTASAGIQAILGTVGQPPAAQIQAIQGSGWSSGGYPDLGSLYAQVAAS